MMYITLGCPPDAAYRLIDFLAMRMESFSVTVEKSG